MKNILKYGAVLFAVLQIFISCEETENYMTEVQAPNKLVYVNQNSNTYNTIITHTPIGTLYEFDVKFPVMANTLVHEATITNLAVDNSLIEAYNAENGTNYAALPDGYMKFENITGLVIPSSSVTSSDSVRLYLDGDLSVLTEKEGYMVPLRLTSTSGLAVSVEHDILHVFIKTVYSSMKINPSAEDITGTLVADRSGWSIVGSTDGSSMFDNGTYTSYNGFTQNNAHVIDLGEKYSISSLRFFSKYANYGSYYSPSKYVIRYSTDGITFDDMGTATSEYIYNLGGYQNIILYAPLTAQYLEVTPSGGSYYYGMAEFDIYEEE